MITVGLTVAGRDILASRQARRRASQNLLPLIVYLLKKKKLTASELSAISVAQGPGSFTGVRLGVSVANTLGFLLGLPVNHQYNPVDIIYD